MLMKLVKPDKHATVIKVDLERQCYTRHGQHLNHEGKDQVASCLAKEITSIFGSQEKLISVPGIVDSGDISSDIIDKDTINHRTTTPTQVDMETTPEVP
jgi:hypothetical protein